MSIINFSLLICPLNMSIFNVLEGILIYTHSTVYGYGIYCETKSEFILLNLIIKLANYNNRYLKMLLHE